MSACRVAAGPRPYPMPMTVAGTAILHARSWNILGMKDAGPYGNHKDKRVYRLRRCRDFRILVPPAGVRHTGNTMDINQLYDRARDGDAAAQRQLFEYLSASFRAFTRHRNVDASDADDIVQTALLRIAESYRQTDIHSSFAGWAHAVLKNTTMEHFRRRNSDRRKTETLARRQAADGSSSPDPRLRTGLADCLKALHESNPTYARVLSLHFQGFTTTEICEKLTMTTSNLYTILSRSRSALRDCLKRKGVLGG